ncbi:MAG: Leukotoxin, partial [Planctomycetota bacterium]
MRFFATMGMAALSLTAFSTAAIVINEVRTDMSGTDTDEYIELKGMPGESLAGLTLVIIGDGTGTATGEIPATKSGAVEFVWQFGKGDVIGSNGFLVLRKDTMVTPIDAGATQVTILPDVATGVFENGQNSTVLLVSGFSGTNTTNGVVPMADGQDLDTDDNGTLDVTPWTAIVDSMVVKQSPGSAPDASNVWWYSANACGPFISRSSQTTTTGGLLAYWGFNDNALPGGGNGYLAGRFPLAADAGDQASTAVVDIGGGLLLDTITNTGGDLVYQWLQSFGGTTNNALAGVISGGSLAVQGGTGATAAGGGNNGSHV